MIEIDYENIIIKFTKETMKLNEKKCCGCGELKLIKEFHLSKNGKLGRESHCKLCVKKRKQEYHIKNRERNNARCKEYGSRHKDKIRERKQLKYPESRDMNLKRCREWGRENREALGNHYITQLLVAKNSLCVEDIPHEVIELKREHLRLKRELRNHK